MTQLRVHVGISPKITLIFCLLGLTVLSAVISSVWPAFVAAKTSIDPVLKQGGMQGGGRGHIVLVGYGLSLMLRCHWRF